MIENWRYRQSFPVYLSPLSLIFCPLLDSEATTKTALRMILLHPNSNRPFATSDHVVQNPPYWRASSSLFPHWDIKTKRPEPVKLDLLLF